MLIAIAYPVAPCSARCLRNKDWLLASYGVWPVTMKIFLRKMLPFWAKADVRHEFRFFVMLQDAADTVLGCIHENPRL
ncbi:hypothetical protein KMZ29_26410 [Bradyrhizobium sediminis]|nr:hypothetical protein [Bradyrhizobium sediminis]QWG13158.1 hypothetical protein KMZ29_26410 [Bradyrhizobium sediminis]